MAKVKPLPVIDPESALILEEYMLKVEQDQAAQ